MDLVIDDERRSNVWGLLMSLDMLMEFEAEQAFDYTFKVIQQSRCFGGL